MVGHIALNFNFLHDIAMKKKKLSNTIKFHLVYQDDTQLGSTISNKCNQTVRHLCSNIVQHHQNHGLQDVIANSRQLMEAALTSSGLSQLYDKPDRLRAQWLYPDVKLVNPVAISLEREIGEMFAQIELPSELFADLTSYLGEWQVGATPPLDPIARQLWDGLEQLGVLTTIEEQSAPNNLASATLVGHSTVRISDGNSSILFDPFLLPKSKAYPPQYQPLSIDELGKIDGVFITHSHPDHFDPGTLIRLGRDLPIFVPFVERESVLALDMVFHLEQLGFTNVHGLQWFEETHIGNIRIVALPFYGEQPTVADILNPEVRNQGNTYLVEVLDQRLVLTADSGTDYLGSIKQLAKEAYDRYGPIDTLFGGYRGFGLYPIQYLFSSIPCYLPFVPRNCWRVRQQMMGDADDLIDVAEIWDAKRIVPYSDGGAPWYWMRGLGPCLDGSQVQFMAVDPTPESVCAIASQRSGSRRDGLIASPIPICLLRPGDALAFENHQTLVHQRVWPYGDTQANQTKLNIVTQASAL